jgi:hypothetical protein
MKKFLGFLMLMCMTLMMASCNGCNQPQDKSSVDSALVDTISIKNAIDVDHAIATDRQAMYMKFKDNYRWYETCIRLPYFLDSDSVTSDPEILVNVFQSIEEFDNGADTYVWKFQHFPDGTVNVDSIHGFWIEDCPLNDEAIKLNYNAAFERMLEVNLPKPHSKNVILRNPIGPVGVNAQWVFGNISEQIWVDAVTGDAKSSNPAFPEEKGFKMPLGEWP